MHPRSAEAGILRTTKCALATLLLIVLVKFFLELASDAAS
jgi:hypothetical protein